MIYSRKELAGLSADKPKRFSRARVYYLARRAGVDFKDLALMSEFRKGLAVEQEHADILGGDEVKLAKTVAAHLHERSDYYTKLDEMEKQPIAKTAMSKIAYISDLENLGSFLRDAARAMDGTANPKSRTTIKRTFLNSTYGDENDAPPHTGPRHERSHVSVWDAVVESPYSMRITRRPIRIDTTSITMPTGEMFGERGPLAPALERDNDREELKTAGLRDRLQLLSDAQLKKIKNTALDLPTRTNEGLIRKANLSNRAALESAMRNRTALRRVK